MFIVNDKGSSWAYATPGFAKTLANAHLLQMRDFAKLTGNQRQNTEVRPGVALPPGPDKEKDCSWITGNARHAVATCLACMAGMGMGDVFGVHGRNGCGR